MRCMQMQGLSVRSTWKWPSGSVTCLGCSQWDLISHPTGPCTHLLVWCSLLTYHLSLQDHKSAWQPLPVHPWSPNIWMGSEKSHLSASQPARHFSLSICLVPTVLDGMFHLHGVKHADEIWIPFYNSSRNLVLRKHNISSNICDIWD